MTDEMKQILTNVGMNVDDAMSRFMNNDTLMDKFLKKFRSDPSFTQLKEAVEARDLDLAFRAAHTLKGVAANFSFTTLQKAASDQTEEFRAGKLDDGIALMDRVQAEYDRIVEALQKIYGEE